MACLPAVLGATGRRQAASSSGDKWSGFDDRYPAGGRVEEANFKSKLHQEPVFASGPVILRLRSGMRMLEFDHWARRPKALY